ncbi:glycerophosphodiester phosphodiesterase family protein [Arthrobacter sp. zg-Y877]|uniref:glycerophosphodiester phosphodiesterase family protein n=1 Tax=Arthrobacter sp. zg-Y877 TaxID=3049074 RepID=UPI0025A3C4CE|nr:glycerophosphodiester phosphodiesterase family protein [Arthrobacter sp. zg-Y877]MDM7989992.1 hypothetical protein [Arthrobacter sp. zg-Y877]
MDKQALGTTRDATGNTLPAFAAAAAAGAAGPRMRADGPAVYPWTLDRPAQWSAAADAGADGIITNRTGALTEWGNTRGRNWTARAI